MRILHVIHDFLPRHRAGSEIYAATLCHALVERGHEVHLLCAEYDTRRPHLSLNWRWHEGLPITEITNNWDFANFADTYQSAAMNEQLEHVVRAVAPDILHIHNLLNLSFQLPRIADRLGIPSVATLHEYVLLCPSGGQRVHLAEEHVCTEIDYQRCARCFRQSFLYSQMAFAHLGGGRSGCIAGLAAVFKRVAPALFNRVGRATTARLPVIPITAGDIEARMLSAHEVFETIDLFVAPSPALGAEFRRFGMPGHKIEVSDYGFVPLAATPRTPRTGRLRIGFAGTLIWHKGAHILIEAARRLQSDAYEVLIFGSLDTFPDYVRELRASADGLPVRFMGSFDGGKAAEVYAQMDVLVIASLWPENSPLVIHEAFMAGLPVVGSNMGGTADLIDDGISGLLYDAFSPDSLASCLQRLLDENDLLGKFANKLPPVKSITEDAESWERTYERSIKRREAR